MPLSECLPFIPAQLPVLLLGPGAAPEGTEEADLIVSLLCLYHGRHCSHHTSLCVAVCLPPPPLAVHLRAQVIGSPVGTVSCHQLRWGSVPRVTPREEVTCHILLVSQGSSYAQKPHRQGNVSAYASPGRSWGLPRMPSRWRSHSPYPPTLTSYGKQRPENGEDGVCRSQDSHWLGEKPPAKAGPRPRPFPYRALPPQAESNKKRGEGDGGSAAPTPQGTHSSLPPRLSSKAPPCLLIASIPGWWAPEIPPLRPVRLRFC